MKVIGFTASPHKEGNTAWAVNKILEGAAEFGAETQVWYSSELDIKPCRGCLACKKGGQGCIISDDMGKLSDAILQSDALIFGSPVYMGQMSGQAKIFTDRLFARFSPRFSPYFKPDNAPKKRLLLAFTQGNPDAGKFRPYFDYTKALFQMLEFDVKEIQVAAGLRDEPAHEKKGLADVLKNAGLTLVSE